MISLSTFLLQMLGSGLIAVFIVWSTYQTYRILLPNNRWFKGLSLLPDALNMGVRAFLVFEGMFLLDERNVGKEMWGQERNVGTRNVGTDKKCGDKEMLGQTGRTPFFLTLEG